MPTMTSAQLVVILTAFLLCAGWGALFTGRALRDRTDGPETTGNVLILAVVFALLAMVGVRFVAPLLEQILTVWR
jgi:hypothetical protein